jgi:acetyl esterase/lipase
VPNKLITSLLYVVVLSFGSVANANPAQVPEVIRIWPAQPPGTEDWAGEEKNTPIQLPGEPPLSMVSNVTVPTLTVYRPAAGKANGTAVIVIPGGGFQMLAMDHEGHDVARWLTERGITAFVLKYRVRMIPGFKMPGDLRKHPERFREFAASFDQGRPFAIADGLQAMRYVRANATQLGIDPERLGMIGFSAGAITTMGVILDGTAAERPNFAAPIYGAMIEDKAPPVDGPPLFLVVTQDDNAVPAEQSVQIYNRWTAAGLPAELHVYERGGHGFGMRKLKDPVGQWTQAFEAWLASHGWAGTKEKAKEE